MPVDNFLDKPRFGRCLPLVRLSKRKSDLAWLNFCQRHPRSFHGSRPQEIHFFTQCTSGFQGPWTPISPSQCYPLGWFLLYNEVAAMLYPWMAWTHSVSPRTPGFERGFRGGSGGHPPQLKREERLGWQKEERENLLPAVE